MLNISLMFVSIIVLLKHYFTLKSKKHIIQITVYLLLKQVLHFCTRFFHYRNYRSDLQIGHSMRFWNILQTGETPTSLHIHTILPEHSQLAHTKFGSG